jgi:hypothetical protein
MKTSNAFKETIKAYLDKRASEDELFAVTYKKENKNLDECCNYVMKCAKDGGCGGYSDDEVFGWAVHYYDEDDIKNIKPVSGKAIVNHSVELTEEDKAEVKAEAMKLAIEEAKVEAKKNLSETIELSEEDIQAAKNQAIEKIATDQKEKLVAKATKKKPGTEVEQVDLFA